MFAYIIKFFVFFVYVGRFYFILLHQMEALVLFTFCLMFL